MQTRDDSPHTPLLVHLIPSGSLRYAVIGVFAGVTGLLAVFLGRGLIELGHAPTEPYILSTMVQILIAAGALVGALRRHVLGAMQIFVAGLMLTLIIEPYIVEADTLSFSLLLMPAGVAGLLVVTGLIFRPPVVAAATVLAAGNTAVVFWLKSGAEGVGGLPLLTVMPLLTIIIIAAGAATLVWDRLATKLIGDARATAETARHLADEREVLVRESSHRVKNNLQVISSVLDLQAREVENEATRNVLADARNRVDAMAIVHQSLHDSGRLDRVDIAVFLQELVDHLMKSLSGPGARVRYEVDAVHARVEPRTLVPLGLVVNELVTNAVQHGLRDVAADDAELRVSLQQTAGDGRFVLAVSDTGVGLPPDFDPETTDSLGLSLVRSIVRDQLEGRFTITDEDGTRAVAILDDDLFSGDD